MAELFGVRPATLDDLETVLTIEKRIHVAPWTITHLKEEILKPVSIFLVLTDDETDSILAGYLIARFLEDECQLLNLGVDLPYRGIGFGKELLRRIVFLAQHRRASLIFLEVRKSNEAAIQLYQNFGFVITHVRKSFYSNGEDAFVMNFSLIEQPADF